MKGPGLLVFILILSGFSALRCGATVYQSDGTAASVQAIHNNQAQNGDTIALPAGTFTWATRVNLWKAITLQGAGIGSTIVKDGVQSGSLIQWILAANLNSRLTGIEFQDGGRINRDNAPGGIMHVSGSNTNGSQFRFDHCKWTISKGPIVLDTVLGVADHNVFIHNAAPHVFFIYGSHWNDQPNGYDYSWADPTNFGSSQFFFLEDNSFTNTNTTYLNWATDALAGARFVVRHNTMLGTAIGDHGTESGGRQRGSRAIEIYNNTMNGNNMSDIVGGSRSSRVIIHDNTFSNYCCGGPHFSLSVYRTHFSFSPWGGADGTNAWDVNEPNAFFTGTAAANSSGTRVQVSGVSWGTDQWKGYVVRRLTDNCNSGTMNFGEILHNTNNTLTYTSADYAANMSICTGDSLEIRKVDQALDAPGRGQGGILANVQNAVPPAGWNNEVTEPCYQWNNGPQASHFTSNTGAVRAGEHYFDNTPMPGYTPYTYPHPLVTGAGRAQVADFNGDGKPDYVLRNTGTRQTAIWYLNNNVLIGTAYGPTLPAGWWGLSGVADFSRDSHSDYALLNSSTGQTGIWYLSGPTFVAGAYGRSLPSGWELVAAADFNGDGYPDYVLYSASTHQTAIWYLNNNVWIGSAYGPPLPNGWSLIGVADFNRDGCPDYVLFNSSTGQTVIGYLSNSVWAITVLGAAYGPTVPSGWLLVAAADFDGDGNPDYLLYNRSSRQTAIWYLNNNVFVNVAYGPTLPPGWSLIGQ